MLLSIIFYIYIFILASYLLHIIAAPFVIYLFLINAHVCGYVEPLPITYLLLHYFIIHMLIIYCLTYYYQFCLSISSLWNLYFVRTICLNDCTLYFWVLNHLYAGLLVIDYGIGIIICLHNYPLVESMSSDIFTYFCHPYYPDSPGKFILFLTHVLCVSYSDCLHLTSWYYSNISPYHYDWWFVQLHIFGASGCSPIQFTYTIL